MTKLDLDQIRKNLHEIVGSIPSHMERYLCVNGTASIRKILKFDQEYDRPFGSIL